MTSAGAMPSSPRVVVAGATGYLGRHVVVAFRDAGFRVRALVRDPARLREAGDACDEVFVGQATEPPSLRGLGEGTDVVFSSIGLRSVARRPTLWEVDCQANLNLLECARAAGVEKFVFISGLHAEQFRSRIPTAEARERVVDRIRASGLRWIVFRPTGFFNDMAAFFAMARRGTAWMLGSGQTRINPIHGADLAAEIVRRVREDGWDRDHEVGGPEVFTVRAIAELAFEVLGKKPRVRSAPAWLVGAAGACVRPFNVNLASVLRGLACVGRFDFVAPACGRHRLRAFFEELAA